MKLSLFVVSLIAVLGASPSYAGTYLCDVELVDGSKTKIRGISADSESEAARIAKENNGEIKYINCMRVN